MAAIFKRDESFTVYEYDNGFMLEVSGRDDNEDWTTAKILCKDLDELFGLIKEATLMNRD